MKTFQILGTGCAKCRTLSEQTEAAAKELGIEYQLEKVTDIQKIMHFGVMSTPALVVDGEVKVVGKVPSVLELKKHPLVHPNPGYGSKSSVECKTKY